MHRSRHFNVGYFVMICRRENQKCLASLIDFITLGRGDHIMRSQPESIQIPHFLPLTIS